MSQRREDYPAAHSMDTDWFAIDEDGRVGVFSSGEEGAVPHNARNQSIDEDELIRLALRGKIPLDLSALTEKADGNFLLPSWDEEVSLRKIDELNSVYECLLWLRDDSPFDDPKHSSLLRVRNQQHVIAFLRGDWKTDYLPRIKELHRRGLVLRGRVYPSVFLHELGVYVYDHWDVYMPGPYVLTTLPKNPLIVTDLPDQMAADVTRCKLDGTRFGDGAIQPMEIIDCGTWGVRPWVQMDGFVHDEEE